jgi:hypothetical protein
MRISRALLCSLGLATALLVAAPAHADVVPRDGTYGGMDARTAAMGLFVMRNQIVAGVQYQIPITCIDSDGNTRQDVFKGGGAFPANTRLNSGLRLRHNYMEADEGMSGRTLGVLVTISFRGNAPTMTVRANRGTDLPCDGTSTITLTRGPLPSGNQCQYNATSRKFTCDQPIPGRSS